MNNKESILIAKSERKSVVAIKLFDSKTTLETYRTIKTVGTYEDDSYVELCEAPNDFELASLIAIMRLLGKEKVIEALSTAFTDK